MNSQEAFKLSVAAVLQDLIEDGDMSFHISEGQGDNEGNIYHYLEITILNKVFTIKCYPYGSWGNSVEVSNRE